MRRCTVTNSLRPALDRTVTIGHPGEGFGPLSLISFGAVEVKKARFIFLHEALNEPTEVNQGLKIS